MKKTSLILIALAFAVITARGQEIPAEDAKQMDEFVLSTIVIQKDKIDTYALTKVFDGNFYKVTPTYSHRGGTASCESYTVVVAGGKLTELEETNETKPLELLTSLVNIDFTIKSEGDARLFEEALDALYPLSWSDDTSDRKHFMKDGKWIFQRASFFESKTGFVVTLDQNAGISQIGYDLEVVKGQ